MSLDQPPQTDPSGGAPGEQPPIPSPPTARRRRKAGAALAAGVLVAAGAAAAVLLTGTDGGGRAVRLSTPPSLDGGAYRLDADTRQLAQQGVSVQRKMPKGSTSVLGRYRRADDAASGLSLSGAYGSIGDPAKVRDAMFSGFEGGASAASVARHRQRFTPLGASGPDIECEVVKMNGLVYAPACTWAEPSDAAMVLGVNTRSTTADSVDMRAFAKVTAGIYRDARKLS